MTKLIPVARPVILLALLLCAVGAWTEDDPAATPAMGTSSVGISGGSITTVGLTYRHWGERVGLQITAGGYVLPAGEGDVRFADLYYSVAVAGDLVLISGNVFKTSWLYSQLYLMASLSHLGEDAYVVEYDPVTFIAVGLTGEAWVPRFRAVAGFGMEIVLFSRFSLTGEIGLGLTVSPTYTDVIDILQAGLMGQGGFQYRF